jgi:peptide/nickel transport system permease protein
MTDIEATPTSEVVPRGVPSTGPVAAEPAAATASATATAPTGLPVGAGVPRRGGSEMFYFAIRNAKVVGGLSILLLFVLFGAFGPLLTEWGPRDRGAGPRNGSPTAENWLGTTSFGQDVFTQLAYGTRTTILVGVLAAAIAAAIGMLFGFLAGYRGGLVDEILMTITNIVLVIPVFVVLVVLSAYLGNRSLIAQGIVIGAFAWPWVARAVRAQTFTLRARDFVDLARLTGLRTLAIIRKEIAPNMGSYLVMVFVLLFAGAVLFAALLDFIGLGPRDTMSLGLMLNQANQSAAMTYGFWWWFIPSGAAITAITGAAYVTNVGLDEVFNPKLREM